MRFIAFIITIIILETLFLFYFKQTSSMIAMSVINLSAVFCFFSKNWRESEKVFKYPLLGGFFIGNILILSREFLEISAKNDGYVFSEVIYGGVILSAIISLFIAGAILFSYAPQDWQRNGSSHHSSHQFSPVNNQNFNDDSAETYYRWPEDDSFSSRIETNTDNLSLNHDVFSADTNPATGLPMCGYVDSAGNMYGTSSHEFSSYSSSFDDSYSSSSSFDNDFNTTSGFDHDDYSRRDS
ncbi:hypothetical protein [Arsenophonus nasoniae]|uniref:Uncharacterized protein n=1 Tax=Arsenophonus nasoniae TaxID=638 RepID=A0AA95GZS5_9GAMM|nr:hypothetical protein [Arsenophonus nasoniae]WGM03362.1 hypothetical protein QE210_17645 [Arsenophonus nasoniae]